MSENQEVESGETKKCKFCGETIHVEAIKCRFCNEFLTEKQVKSNFGKYFLLFLFFILVSAFAIGFFLNVTAKIDGQITDGKSKPISNATISIQGTQFKTNTDFLGRYSIKFVPGQFTVNVSASGYFSKDIPFNITNSAVIPAATVVLQAKPEISTWENFLREEIPKNSFSFGMGKATISEFARIESIKVLDFEKVTEGEALGKVTAHYRANEPVA